MEIDSFSLDASGVLNLRPENVLLFFLVYEANSALIEVDYFAECVWAYAF